MSEIASVTGLLNDYSINKVKEGEPKSNELGQTAFLELMITQLNNQDPLSPQDNSEFVAQLAQFSSVEGIDRLNNTTDGMANTFRSSQALQASAMVGRKVHVPGNVAALTTGGTVTGIIDLESSTDRMSVSVKNDVGELVRTIDLGQNIAGEISFAWDGKNNNGIDMPAGKYHINVSANIGGDSIDQQIAVSANVNSVTIGKNNELTLNVEGIGAVGLSQVREIF